jgi:hypothetical protein
MVILTFIIDDSITDEMFINNSKEILSAFFEDRAEELAESLVTNWPRYLEGHHEIENEYSEQLDKIKLRSAILLEKQHNKNITMRLFYKWKHNILNEKNIQLDSRLEEEKLKCEELESSNFNDKIQIKELRDKVLNLESHISKELDLKRRKKEATAKRLKMKEQKDVSKSLALSKAGFIPSNKSLDENPYLIEEFQNVKIAELEKLLNRKGRVRSNNGYDQRGSTYSTEVHRRQKLFKSKDRHSLISASVISDIGSNFSFHPEINRTKMWKPKYDDHDDHEKMWNRMHKENSKIQTKKRIMSREKEMRELSQCTFTPKLVTANSRQPKVSKHSSKEAESLGNRMYDYADKFKKNLKEKKSIIEHERGQETYFTPKIVTTKTLNINRSNGEVYEDLYNDNATRKTKIMQKVKSKNSQVLSMFNLI